MKAAHHHLMRCLCCESSVLCKTSTEAADEDALVKILRCPNCGVYHSLHPTWFPVRTSGSLLQSLDTIWFKKVLR